VLTALIVAHSSAWAGRASDDRTCANTPNPESAIEACTRLYENEGLGARNRAIALGNRGAAFKLMGRYDEALADFDLAIELDPKNPQYRCQRGDALVRKRQFDEAIAAYSEALKLSPKNGWAFHGRGTANLAKGDGAAAAADFTQALRARPGELNILVLRGRAYLQQGSYLAAEADFAKALASPALKKRLPKERAAVLSLHAFALLKLGNAREAGPKAEEAVKLAPKNTFALSVKGLVDEQTGLREAAVDAFERALAVEPKLEVAQQGLERLSGPTTGALPEPPPASPSNAAAELCARFIAAAGQTVLVPCDD
jgi:tetratricopeptide (TPR) repeat protein